MSKGISVTLLGTQKLVDEFRAVRGLNFSEALRFIIEDYFRIRRTLQKNVDENFNQTITKDLDTIKRDVDEAKKMLLVIGDSSEELRDAFVKYFPKYFS